MLATLMESQHQRTSSFRAQLFSVTLHTGLIFGAIAATETVVQPIDVTEPPPTVVWLPPPTPVVESPYRGPISLPQLPAMPTLPVLMRVPDLLPDIDLSRTFVLTDADVALMARGLAGGDPRGVATTTDVGGMTADQVDRPAHLLAGTGRPLYPEALRSAGLAGDVNVQFVIDTLGRADMRTLTVLSSSNDRFTESVKRALEKARFAPAEFGGRRVRQVVRMPFVLSLQK